MTDKVIEKEVGISTEKLFPCKTCGQHFKREQNLIFHNLYKHPDVLAGLKANVLDDPTKATAGNVSTPKAEEAAAKPAAEPAAPPVPVLKLDDVMAEIRKAAPDKEKLDKLATRLERLLKSYSGRPGIHPKPTLDFINQEWEGCPECKVEWEKIKAQIAGQALDDCPKCRELQAKIDAAAKAAAPPPAPEPVPATPPAEVKKEEKVETPKTEEAAPPAEESGWRPPWKQ